VPVGKETYMINLAVSIVRTVYLIVLGEQQEYAWTVASAGNENIR
jgi:hypothetical protein